MRFNLCTAWSCIIKWDIRVSLSHSSWGGGSPPQSIPGSPEVSWISYEQAPVMNCQKLDPGFAVLCWAGEVEDKRQTTIAIGRQLLGRRRVQTLPPRKGGRIGSWVSAPSLTCNGRCVVCNLVQWKQRLLSMDHRKSPLIADQTSCIAEWDTDVPMLSLSTSWTSWLFLSADNICVFMWFYQLHYVLIKAKNVIFYFYSFPKNVR